MITPPFLAFTAIRVPPLQFQHLVGLPPRLVTTDLLSGCGPLTMPPFLADILKLLHDGTAYIDSIVNSAINQINTAINSVLGPLNDFIAQTTGALQAGLQSMLNAITGSGLDAVHSAIGNIVDNMPSLANMISNAGQLHASMGFSPLASLESIFGPIINGGLNTLLSPVLGAIQGIESAINQAIAFGINTISSVLAPLTSALNSALSSAMGAVNAAISQITSAIGSALTSMTNAATAAAMSVICKGAHELNDFIDKIASPALKAALPAPQ